VPDPIEFAASVIDLSSRFVANQTVVASPAAAAETIIASITVPDGPLVVSGILVVCQAAFTVGTAGVSARFRIRQTNVTGTVVGDTGAITETAANLDSATVAGFDTAPPAGRIYKVTMIVASGSAASTVSALTIAAVAI
jgi:hypothetical protein